MLRTTSASQRFCGPVNWLQDCGVAFLGESRGRRGFWTIHPMLDPILDTPDNPAVSGQSCVVCGGCQSHGRADRSYAWAFRCGGQPEKELQTHITHWRRWRSAGCLLGKRLPRLGAAWGKKMCSSLTRILRLQVPGLLGTTQNELGIRKWLEDQGHTLVTTSDKEGENSTFDKELVDAEIIITTP